MLPYAKWNTDKVQDLLLERGRSRRIVKSKDIIIDASLRLFSKLEVLFELNSETQYTLYACTFLWGCYSLLEGSDLSNLPEYCIAGPILKLRAHNYVSSKSQFRESHRREVYEDMKKKSVAQELKMKFFCGGGWGSQGTSCSEACRNKIRNKFLSIQATTEMEST